MEVAPPSHHDRSYTGVWTSSSVYNHTQLSRGHSLDLGVYTPTVGFTPQNQDPGKRPMQLWEPVPGLELQVWEGEDVL